MCTARVWPARAPRTAIGPTSACPVSTAGARRTNFSPDSMSQPEVGTEDTAESPASAVKIGATSGETPHRYLQPRRVEHWMFLLRETDRSITDICFDVGFTSLGTFSRTFREIVGETPSDYRLGHGPLVAPNCFQMAAMRPQVAAGVGVPTSRRSPQAGGSSRFRETPPPRTP